MSAVGRRGFRAAKRGVELRIDEVEAKIAADLLAQMVEFVAPPDAPPSSDPLAALVGIAPEAAKPADPALLRLLPDGYRDDPAAADDFRRFTERGLREQKAANARTALASLQRGGKPIVMSAEEGRAWLLALNDLRLTLGVRLGISDDEVNDDPLYDWLTWLQATLVDALMP